jgi:hypothetical protein
MVRNAMGNFIFCQQPTQKIGCDAIRGSSISARGVQHAAGLGQPDRPVKYKSFEIGAVSPTNLMPQGAMRGIASRRMV